VDEVRVQLGCQPPQPVGDHGLVGAERVARPEQRVERGGLVDDLLGRVDVAVPPADRRRHRQAAAVEHVQQQVAHPVAGGGPGRGVGERDDRAVDHRAVERVLERQVLGRPGQVALGLDGGVAQLVAAVVEQRPLVEDHEQRPVGLPPESLLQLADLFGGEQDPGPGAAGPRHLVPRRLLAHRGGR
jgi:hypothetical protein